MANKSVYCSLFTVHCSLLTALICILGWMMVLPGVARAGRIVSDQLGRSIHVPDAPQRIVSFAPNITEIVFALNQGQRLVGATQFSDYPDDAKHLPQIGSYVNLNIEKIVALKPDLCIATKDGNPIEVIRLLESLNIPVYAVDPRDLDTVMKTVTEIGALLDAKKEADALVGHMKRRIDRVKSLVSSTSHRPRVFCQIGISPIVSAGSNTCIDGMIQMAGGENIAKGPASYPRFSHEQILGLAPDVFIITSMERGEVFERVKAQWQQWLDLPAAKNNRIVLVDSNLLDRPSPRLVDGLELLLQIIHPELSSGGK
jgi:iron complex transport system substrate-binding protein